MVLKENGEIYNIKGYGTPDQNKKIKANLGNINDYINPDGTFNPIKINWLFDRQYNYLR
jgi:hypothetical protein